MRNRLYKWCLASLVTAATATTAFAEEKKVFPLDILLVVDNSPSMREEHEKLANRLDSLLHYVHFLDWRIGVVTTDVADGCLRTVISKGDSNYLEKYARAIRAGSSGSGKERGFSQAVAALKNECGDKSWVRDHSNLAIVFASDEDNCSKDARDCSDQPDASPEYVMDYLKQIRIPGLTARVYGLIWHPTTPKSSCQTAFRRGTGYASLIRRTLGLWGSICQADFADSLEAISQDMAKMGPAE